MAVTSGSLTAQGIFGAQGDEALTAKEAKAR